MPGERFGCKSARLRPMFSKRNKKGIRLKIPGFGDRHIQTVLSDYDGTLSCGGKVGPLLKDQLIELAGVLDIHILTGDKKAKSADCFGRLPVHVHILSEGEQDIQKRK